MRVFLLFLFLIKFCFFGENILNSDYLSFLGDRINYFECLVNNIDYKLVVFLFIFELFFFLLNLFSNFKSKLEPKKIHNERTFSLEIKPTTEALIPNSERKVNKDRLTHTIRELYKSRISPQYVKVFHSEENIIEEKLIKTPFLGLYYPASSSILSVCIRFMGAAFLGLIGFYIIIYNDILNTPELNIFFFDVFFLVGMGLLFSHIISSISHVLPVEDVSKISFMGILTKNIESMNLYLKTSFLSNSTVITSFLSFIDQSLIFYKKIISFLSQFFIFNFISEISFANKCIFFSLLLVLL